MYHKLNVIQKLTIIDKCTMISHLLCSNFSSDISDDKELVREYRMRVMIGFLVCGSVGIRIRSRGGVR